MDRSIIFELKEEHKAIIIALNEVNFGGNLEETKVLIQTMQSVVTEHLRKEDTVIYPALLGSQNEALVSLGTSFLHSMIAYSEIFVDVTRRIGESSGSIDAGLVSEYESMRNKIKDRIFVEETALFPAYESIC
ncbi:MAG: hemerythrin domain-containing protein [Candidatus Moraniibacteriota bacterium]